MPGTAWAGCAYPKGPKAEWAPGDLLEVQVRDWDGYGQGAALLLVLGRSDEQDIFHGRLLEVQDPFLAWWLWESGEGHPDPGLFQQVFDPADIKRNHLDDPVWDIDGWRFLNAGCEADLTSISWLTRRLKAAVIRDAENTVAEWNIDEGRNSDRALEPEASVSDNPAARQDHDIDSEPERVSDDCGSRSPPRHRSCSVTPLSERSRSQGRNGPRKRPDKPRLVPAAAHGISDDLDDLRRSLERDPVDLKKHPKQDARKVHWDDTRQERGRSATPRGPGHLDDRRRAGAGRDVRGPRGGGLDRSRAVGNGGNSRRVRENGGRGRSRSVRGNGGVRHGDGGPDRSTANANRSRSFRGNGDWSHDDDALEHRGRGTATQQRRERRSRSRARQMALRDVGKRGQASFGAPLEDDHDHPNDSRRDLDRRRPRQSKRTPASDDSDSDESVFRLASSSKGRSSQARLIDWAARYPGRLAATALQKMENRVGRDGEAAAWEAMATPASAKSYFLRVLKLDPVHNRRNLREMYTVATALDHLALGRHRQAADLLTQRLKALELASSSGNWERAQFLELLEQDTAPLVDNAEAMMVCKEADFLRKLNKSANSFNNDWSKPNAGWKPNAEWSTSKGKGKGKSKGKGKGKGKKD